jgi:Divergent InlB B-repeat domain
MTLPSRIVVLLISGSLAFAAALLPIPGTASAETGSLTQLSGALGCIEQDPMTVEDTCGTDTLDSGDELSGARSVASYDGYVFAAGSDNAGWEGIVVLKAQGTGLTAVSCIDSNGENGCAEDGELSNGQDAITDLTVSPAGNLYATIGNGEILGMSFNASTGALSAIAKPGGCIAETDASGCNTTPNGVDPGHQIVFAPSGSYAYSDGVSSVISYAVAAGGGLSAIGCVQCGLTGSDEVTLPNETASETANMIGLAITPDGSRVYAVDDNELTIWMFDVSGDGTLALPDGSTSPIDYCVEDGSSFNGGMCAATARGLTQLTGSIVTSPDQAGQFVYAVSGGESDPGRILEFEASQTGTPVGALSQLGPAPAGCISSDGSDDESTPATCATGPDLGEADDALISPDGQNLYVTAGYESNGDLIALAANAATGALSEDPLSSGSEPDCYTDDGTGPSSGPNPDCVQLQGILGLDFNGDEAGALTINPPGAATVGASGSELYLPAETDDGVADLQRVTPPQYTVGGAPNVGADGSVAASSQSAQAACSGQTCTVYPNAAVVLAPTANAGYRFKDWSGGSCSGGVNPCTVNPVDASESDTANFVQRFTVGAGVNEGGPANSVSAADGSSNDPACSGASCTVDAGDTVTLTANAASGYRFTGWSGGSCAGQGNPCTVANVTSDGDASDTADFIARYTVSGPASSSGGTVQVSSSSSTASCAGGSCTVDAGSQVSLQAVPASGFSFTGWSGGSCSGTANPCTVSNVQASETDTAGFVLGAPPGNPIYVNGPGADIDPGSAGNPGTQSRPLDTISHALAVIAAEPGTFNQIIVAAGGYSESITLTSADNGLGIYGGYQPGAGGWSASANGVSTITGSPQAVLAQSATGITLQQLTLDATPDSTGSDYGVRAIQGAAVTLNDVAVNAANASPGVAGATGASGAAGSAGSSGYAGYGGITNPFADPSPTDPIGLGGNGGGGADGANGGCGGGGVWPGQTSATSGCSNLGNFNGNSGGTAPGGGAGGAGGAFGPTANDASEGCDPAGDCSGETGHAGGAGLGGATGAAGQPGASPSSQGDSWTGGAGSTGATGAAGGGGGGGGGGGQSACSPACFASTGDGGGGGGGGGTGGAGGLGGGPGGGSFGLYLNGGSSVTAEVGTSITAGNGGDGGAGGAGGQGGAGGAGGPGSMASECEGVSDACGGFGAAGGSGGAGGQGGGGGGGAGGPSYAVFTADGTSSRAPLAEDTVLAAGSVGQGGTTPGGTNGANGTGGAATPCSTACTYNPTLPVLPVYALVNGAYVSVDVGCPASEPSCNGTATLTGTTPTGTASDARAARVRTVTLGTTKFKLKGHKLLAVRIKLNAAGRRFVKRIKGKKGVPVKLAVTITAPGKKAIHKTIRLTLYKHKPKPVKRKPPRR